MAKIEQKKLFDTFMKDVNPQIDNIMNAYKQKEVVKTKGSLFESFDSGKPKVSLFEEALEDEADIKESIDDAINKLMKSVNLDPRVIQNDARRYSQNFATATPSQLVSTLRTLSDNDSDKNINKSKIFLMAILFGMINELNHSVGGFAFEYFLAGLTNGEVLTEGFKDNAADVKAGEYKYQAKFLQSRASKISLSSNYDAITTSGSSSGKGKFRFQFVVAAKTPDGVDFCIFPYDNEQGNISVPQEDNAWISLKFADMNKLIDISFIQPITQAIENAGDLIDEIKNYAGKITTKNKSTLSKGKIQTAYDATGESLGIK